MSCLLYTSIIGASGSGKSTLLRCINLLETPTTGDILYHNTDITSGKMSAASYRTKVGMVFQSFNLFNNMTVLDNCIDVYKRQDNNDAGHCFAWHDCPS